MTLDEDLFGRGDGDPDGMDVYPGEPVIRHDAIPGRWIGQDTIKVDRRYYASSRRDLGVDYDQRFDEDQEQME